MKILVTGGSGFIGNSVVRHLVSKGYNVRAFDLVTSNLKDIEHYSGSILDPNALDIAMRGCDVVIHLAAMLGVKRTEIKRLSCINVNVQGFQNVLEAGVKRRIKKVLLASSSEVYVPMKQYQFSDSYITPFRYYLLRSAYDIPINFFTTLFV